MYLDFSVVHHSSPSSSSYILILSDSSSMVFLEPGRSDTDVPFIVARSAVIYGLSALITAQRSQT